MKILFQGRSDLYKNRGGDTIVLENLKRDLEKKGILVDISIELSPDLTTYDLIQLYGITRVHETYSQFLNAKRQRKKVALVPIYEDLSEWDEKGRYGRLKYIYKFIKSKDQRELIKTLYRTFSTRSSVKPLLRQLKGGYLSIQRELVAGCDYIFVNSRMEAEMISRNLKIGFEYKIIPYCVDTSYLGSRRDQFVKAYGFKDFVLCVARIESKKNQLRLLKALSDEKIPVVLIGKENRFNKGYCREVKEWVRKIPHFYYLGEVEETLKRSAMAAAKVHILPSWFELTGLSSMEAALAGCNIVTTDRGCTKEYFKDLVWYCDPRAILSIREAALGAYRAPFKETLKKHILANFTWDKAAKKAYQAYLEIV